VSAWLKLMAVSDTHGDMIDKAAAKIALQFKEDFKPDEIIHMGDGFDFRAIRRGADNDEKVHSMQEDVFAGKEFLEELRPTWFLRGNHDERLWDLRDCHNAVVRDYACMCVKDLEQFFKKLKIKTKPYDKRAGVLKFGHLKLIHGYHAGQYACKAHGERYGSCWHGHTHAIDSFALPRLERTVARSIGCLCKLDYQYNRAFTASLRHAHGFAYALVHKKTGVFHSFQAEKVGGRWILPTDFKIYTAKGSERVG